MISPEMLRRYAFFASLAPEQCTRIAMLSKLVQHQEGEWIIREGEPPDYLYILTAGVVDLCLRLNASEERYLDCTTINEGMVVGWSALVADQRFASVRARTPVEAIAIDGERLMALCEEEPELGFQVMHGITLVMYDRLCSLTTQVASLAHTPGHEEAM